MSGAIPPIQSGSHIHVPASAVKERVQALCVKADFTGNIEEKKAAYEEAFTVLVEAIRLSGGRIVPETGMPLFTLLELYAGKCCYAQQGKEDPKEGFRKSAKLMECSLELQLDHAVMLKSEISIGAFSSLNALVDHHHLGYAKSAAWSVSPKVEALLSFDENVLLQKMTDSGLMEPFLNSFQRLVYSYQNIDEASRPKDHGCIVLHENLNALYEALIGQETESSLRKLVDFRYNRALFMVNLKSPGNLDAQVKCYDRVEALYEKAFASEPLELQSRLAQIANMRGLVFLRTEDPERYAKAAPYTRRAFSLREAIIGQFPTTAENDSQKFLLNNIRTSLVLIELDFGNKEEAIRHADALSEYVKELSSKGDKHAYIDSYNKAIKTVADSVYL